MSSLDLSTQNWEEQVIRSKEPVAVDFWATWCPWCRKLMPVYDELSGDYQGRVKFAKVNVEQAQEIAQRYGVMSLPTIKFFCQGRPVAEVIGYLPKENLRTEIEKVMRTHRECLEQSSPVRSS